MVIQSTLHFASPEEKRSLLFLLFCILLILNHIKALLSMRSQLESLYCSYYQAHVQRELALYVVAALRSYEHLAFDRTLDPETSLFEFFVPTSTEEYFLTLMHYLQSEGLVLDLTKMPNRLINSDQL